jgi:hypothetical protein
MYHFALICVLGSSVHGSLAAGNHIQLLSEDAWTKRAWELADIRKIQTVCAVVWAGFALLTALIGVTR